MLYSAAAVYLLIFFFPTLFLSRVLSPVDVFYSYDPWRSLREVESQNGLMNDPATSYITLVSLMKEDPASFHWNRWIASGVPGYGSAAAAVCSPFILLPAILLPLNWVFSGTVLLKFLVPLLGMYLFLRELRLGKRASAIGAVATAGAGIYAVWYLWQGTNATSLYPLLLLTAARIAHGKRNSVLLMTVLAISFALSGFPATVIYGGYLAGLFLLIECVRRRVFPWRELLRALLAVTLGALIALPALAPFFYLIKNSGYLVWREGAAARGDYPLQAWRAFVDPLSWGDPLEHRWSGDPRLGTANNFIDSTLYLGLIPLALAPLALFARRKDAWLWAAATLVLLLVLFGVQPFAGGAAALPGVGYSQLVRLRMLLPPLAGILCACGWLAVELRLLRRWRFRLRHAAAIVAALISFDLALFGARFHPYLERDVLTLPKSPTVAFLRGVPEPFRIAPMFDYLWPNTTELVRLEDVRSHFSSEARYRMLLERFAPKSFGESGTVIQFNALQFDASDPLVGMLNVRFIIEQPTIDILRWKVLENTTPASERIGDLQLAGGTMRSITFALPDDRTYAVELPAEIRAPGTVVLARVRRTASGEVVAERRYDAADAAFISRIYVPLWKKVMPGEALVFELNVVSGGLSVPADGAGEPLLGWVRTPLIPHSMRVDGKVFENAAALPRYWPVWETRKLSFEEMLADRSIDFSTTAIVTGADYSIPASNDPKAKIRIIRYDGATIELEVESSAPFLLATSEKLTPDLRVQAGKRATPVEINGMFLGVGLPPGKQKVVITRRLGRDYWPLSIAAFVVLIAAAIFEARGRTTRMI